MDTYLTFGRTRYEGLFNKRITKCLRDFRSASRFHFTTINWSLVGEADKLAVVRESADEANFTAD